MEMIKRGRKNPGDMTWQTLKAYWYNRALPNWVFPIDTRPFEAKECRAEAMRLNYFRGKA
jgi:hypothetical protein